MRAELVHPRENASADTPIIGPAKVAIIANKKPKPERQIKKILKFCIFFLLSFPILDLSLFHPFSDTNTITEIYS